MVTVSQLRGDCGRAREVAGALAGAAAARAAEHTAASHTLRPRLAALQQLVERARHAADSVRTYVHYTHISTYRHTHEYIIMNI